MPVTATRGRAIFPNRSPASPVGRELAAAHGSSCCFRRPRLGYDSEGSRGNNATSSKTRHRLRAARHYQSLYARYKRNTGQRVPALELIRFFDPWYRSLGPGRSPIEDEGPWIVFSALDLLEKRIAPGMRVLEFGMGGSTLYFLRRGCVLASIEHDETWTEAVSTRLSPKLQKEWTPLLVPPDATPIAEFCSEQPGSEGLSFQAYVRRAEGFEDGGFDVVMVDGRARSACIRHALPKIRRDGGILILDNAERPRYEPGRALADAACTRRFVCGGPGPFESKEFWQTVIWQF